MKYNGVIESIFGPMFSGKTSELMRRIKRHRLAMKKCLVINYLGDSRYLTSNTVVSHDLISIPAIKVNRLSEIDQAMIADKEVIGVDEGQFFEDLIEKTEEWANMGKVVIVAALDCTYQKKPFGRVTELLAISEDIKKLSAVCMDCGKDASFTQRTAKSDSIELIGGIEMYKPVCRMCYHKNMEEESLLKAMRVSDLSEESEKTVKKPLDREIENLSFKEFDDKI